jgi:hypothetical protein
MGCRTSATSFFAALELGMDPTFKIYGPYRIPVENGVQARYIKTGCPHFWEQETTGRLVNECGCYLFALRAGKGFRPIYVGRATKGFRKECFAHHKIAAHYGPALCNSTCGTPVLFLVVLRQKKGLTNKKAIAKVERFLIQTAMKKNPDLSNVKGKREERWRIKGVVRGGKGKVSRAARQFRTAIGLG